MRTEPKPKPKSSRSRAERELSLDSACTHARTGGRSDEMPSQRALHRPEAPRLRRASHVEPAGQSKNGCLFGAEHEPNLTRGARTHTHTQKARAPLSRLFMSSHGVFRSLLLALAGLRRPTRLSFASLASIAVLVRHLSLSLSLLPALRTPSPQERQRAQCALGAPSDRVDRARVCTNHSKHTQNPSPSNGSSQINSTVKSF